MRLAAFSLALVLACSAGPRNSPAQPLGTCPSFAVSMEGWQEVRAYEVGAQLSLPPKYQRMEWERRSDPTEIRADFWKDMLPGYTVTLRRTSTNATHVSPARDSSAVDCTIATGSGTANAVVQRLTISTGAGTTGTLFTLELRLPTTAPDTILLMITSARDSAALKEQLAAARTLRLR